MYVDGSVDFDGPACLPQGNAATCIKPHKIHALKAMAKEHIVLSLSSEEDMSKVVKRVKKAKAKPVPLKTMSLKKGKSKYVPTDDSSDNDDTHPTTEGDRIPHTNVNVVAPTSAVPINSNAAKSYPTTQGLKIKDNYQGPGPSGKRKANAIVLSHISKKPALQSQKPDPDGGSTLLHERHRWSRKESKESFKVGHRLIETSRGKGAKNPSK